MRWLNMQRARGKRDINVELGHFLTSAKCGSSELHAHRAEWVKQEHVMRWRLAVGNIEVDRLFWEGCLCGLKHVSICEKPVLATEDMGRVWGIFWTLQWWWGSCPCRDMVIGCSEALGWAGLVGLCGRGLCRICSQTDRGRISYAQTLLFLSSQIHLWKCCKMWLYLLTAWSWD